MHIKGEIFLPQHFLSFKYSRRFKSTTNKYVYTHPTYKCTQACREADMAKYKRYDSLYKAKSLLQSTIVQRNKSMTKKANKNGLESCMNPSE